MWKGLDVVDDRPAHRDHVELHAFRVIHHDKFAEFLIATEIEVEKVHWPDRQHVQRASIVVIVTMLMMGAMLFIFDMIWRYVFSLIGFLQFVD